MMCTVHAANSDHPIEVYRFFRDERKTEFIQFLPIIERVTPQMLPIANLGWGERGSDPRPLYLQEGTKRRGWARRPRCASSPRPAAARWPSSTTATSTRAITSWSRRTSGGRILEYAGPPCRSTVRHTHAAEARRRHARLRHHRRQRRVRRRRDEHALSVDQQVVALGRFFSADDGCDVGMDTGSPVSPDYGPWGNECTGRVKGVQIAITEGAENASHLVSPEESIRVAMARQ